MDSTPITLSHMSSMQVAVQMFEKLGLRYLLLTSKGYLMGLITKKDVIRNMASLDEVDEVEEEREYSAYGAHEGGLLDEDEHRRSGESE